MTVMTPAAARLTHRLNGRRAPGALPRDGFTLISVMIAVVMLTVGLLALSRTQTTLLGAQATASSRSSALEVARGYMEEVRARDPWTLASEGEVRLAMDGRPDAGGPLRRTLVVSEAESNLVRVTVSVAGTRGDRPIELVTYVYRGAR